MHKKIIKTISVLMTVVLLTGMVFSVETNALTSTEIKNEINALEKESKELEAQIKSLQGKIDEQEKLKQAIEEKMIVVQKQINACNKQINIINSQIAANNAEIKKVNSQIEDDKNTFKKRLRAIYMSNTGSNVQVLLGAEDFSQFLQLAQLTASVSARDKKLIETLVNEIKILEKKQVENEKLLQNQKSIKDTITQKQAELSKEEQQIQSVINSISITQDKAEADNKQVENDLKKMQKALNDILYSGGSGNNMVYDGGDFLWPTPTIRTISSYYGERWGRNHNGVDISNGTFGNKVIAIADGVVETYSNSCRHNYRKKPLYNCCGNGYGNYITINHGKKNGKYYVAYYAHLGSIVVASGTHVKKGQIIGYVGSTGRSTGPHLHFGISLQTRNSNGKVTSSYWVNPMSYYK